MFVYFLMDYIYEFTNGRKLTKREFLNWFEKKFLYTIRKFEMIKKNDIIFYKNKGNLSGVVLENLLEMFVEKAPVKIVTKGKYTKKVLNNTLDTETEKIIQTIINGKVNSLKKSGPVEGKEIKPLYLFLDKEIKLYAKLNRLKYKKINGEKKDNVSKFIEDMEKFHPELKHAVVQSYLELYK